MNDDGEYLFERIKNQAGTNQIVVVLDSKCCKIEREEYVPDSEGILKFHKKTDWKGEGYSVDEAIELIKKYKDEIKDIKFEAYDGKMYSVVNVFESDKIGGEFEFSCYVVVGDRGSAMTEYGNIENENWVIDTSERYGMRRFNY